MTQTELQVEIIGYNSQYDKDFARLNYEWLNQYFSVEPHDSEMLDAPYTYIIKPGGWILFAKVDEQIVGTVALIIEDESTFELAKMAVSPSYKGLKIGKKLMEAAINYSKSVDKKRLVLESNTKLTPAINLYISAGFKAAPLNPDTPYERCNIRMVLNLS
ncbi:MAG: GNAT family N-acetyltransferase [Cyclobacteriaceae bacterium]|nr:GNAT family N-acetyltransferase [Cyclobacteriaceae bacterium HetDA_MAG_MS6]